jgi:hypothetical protein
MNSDMGPEQRTGSGVARGEGARPLAILAAAFILWISLTLALGLGISSLFAAGPVGLLALPVVFTLTVVAITFALRALLGRHHVLAALCATGAAWIALLVVFFRAATIPILWVQPGFELTHVLIALPAAAMVGLFFDSVGFRIGGGIAVAALVAVTLLIPGRAAPPQADPFPTLEEREAARESEIDAFLADGAYALVPDLEGYELTSLSLGWGSSTTMVRTPSDGEVRISVQTGEPADYYPCLAMVAPYVDIASTPTLESFASWCYQDDLGWHRVDNVGEAFIRDGRLIIVVATFGPSPDVADQAVAHATGVDIDAVVAALRPMTDAEVRQAYIELNPLTP